MWEQCDHCLHVVTAYRGAVLFVHFRQNRPDSCLTQELQNSQEGVVADLGRSWFCERTARAPSVWEPAEGLVWERIFCLCAPLVISSSSRGSFSPLSSKWHFGAFYASECNCGYFIINRIAHWFVAFCLLIPSGTFFGFIRASLKNLPLNLRYLHELVMKVEK